MIMKLKRFTLTGGPLDGQECGYNLSEGVLSFYVIDPGEDLDTFHSRQGWGPHTVAQTYMIPPEPCDAFAEYSISIGILSENDTALYGVIPTDDGLSTRFIAKLGYLLEAA